MEFLAKPLFTKLICELLSDDDYRLIQRALVLRSDAGRIIRGRGGLGLKLLKSLIKELM